MAILLLDPLVERNSFYSITHSPDAIKYIESFYYSISPSLIIISSGIARAIVILLDMNSIIEEASGSLSMCFKVLFYEKMFVINCWYTLSK